MKKDHTRRRSALPPWLAAVLTAVLVLSAMSFSTPTPAAAASPNLTLTVRSASSHTGWDGPGGAVAAGDAITAFEYIINVDDTGTTGQRTPSDGCSPASAGYPDSCNWVSVAGVPSGSSPIVAQGTDADFAGTNGLTLPDGKYLISVRAANFKIDGAHFEIAGQALRNVTVEMQPTPLPPATVQAAVFEDISPVNGAPDLPAEHGLAGFEAHLADYLGEISTDVLGNPLGAEYDVNGNYVPGTGGKVLSKCYVVENGADTGTVAPIGPRSAEGIGECPTSPNSQVFQGNGNPVPATAVIEGKVKIPNLGPARYALSVIAPDGETWIQTTTLEGNHDWDAWVMEGATGLDTEFIVAGEPFPATIFGFVPPMDQLSGGPGTGTVTGTVAIGRVYIPPTGGVSLPGEIWGGVQGMTIDGPIDSPWVSLTSLTNGDTAVYVGQGDANGDFTINDVPDGTYTLTWWDEPQNYILDLTQVIVNNGEVVDLGVLPLTGWWTYFDGYVFEDLNYNGKRDPGEPGVPNFTLTMRKRENSLMDRGATTATTEGSSGYYVMENTYPMTQWLVMEAYNDLFYTTGITYQADNQPTETTVLGAGVDLSVLPIIGLSGRVDWGVHRYDPQGITDPQNGGIVGTVSYDTTRNEFDPRYAAVEDWQPSIPGLTVTLHQPVDCTDQSTDPCDENGFYELDPATGAYKQGQLLNTYLTETWERPTGCVARNVDGVPLVHGVDENVLPLGADDECLEGPMMGVQFGPYATDQGTLDANFGAAVDGNYGFGDGCFAPNHLDPNAPVDAPVCLDGNDQEVAFETLPSGTEYLVSVEVPNDPVTGRPMYKVTREEDINVNEGTSFQPQVPPPACAGDMHIVDVAGVDTDGYGPLVISDPSGFNSSTVTVPASTPTINATFADAGGSGYEGQAKPLCDTKLVTLPVGASIAPAFNFYTDVPLPGRFWGLIVDDLTFSGNPQSLLYGEKQGVPFAPVGIYDYADRLVHTTESDYNGLFDVLMPSTNTINCPTPSGVCAGLYRFVGNDPGTPGRLNLNYKPQYRTIAAEFEAFPGLIVPADLAPTQVGVQVQLPGGQQEQVSCPIDATEPALYRVSRPYVDRTDSGDNLDFTISGAGFEASQGVGEVTLDGTALDITSWASDTIAVTVPGSVAPGPHQLAVTNNSGLSSSNGLTFHVLDGANSIQEPAFPATGVLDNFDRDNGNVGPDWTGNQSGPNWFRIQGSEYVQVRSGGRMNWQPGGGDLGTMYDSDQEAYLTLTQISARNAADQGVILKHSGGAANPFGGTNANNGAAFIAVTLNTGSGDISVRTKDRTGGAALGDLVTQATFTPANPVVNGDVLGARSLSDGTVIAYVNGVEAGRVNVVTNGWPAELASGAGHLGVWFTGINDTNPANNALFDDFGGGSVPGVDYTNYAFPATASVDDFNRPTPPVNIGANWNGDRAANQYRIASDAVEVRDGGRIFYDGVAAADGVFDANQEAWFTFDQISARTQAEQGLVLKFTPNNGGTFGGQNARNGAGFLAVVYNPADNTNTAPGTVSVLFKNRTDSVAQANANAIEVATEHFGPGDQLGARALSDGTVIVYKNGTQVGLAVNPVTSGWDPALAAGTGYIGTWFVGTNNNVPENRAGFDDFGGGSIRAAATSGGGYHPTVYEVGPGRTFAPADSLPASANHAIQNAIDAAAASPEDDLIVVYPNDASVNPRVNPRGAYYENLILTKPVKLQGVGPGSPDGVIGGSIIDGGAFGGDSPVFDDWWAKMASLTWAGNQNVFDGAAISIFAEGGGFPTTAIGDLAARIDGFDIRGGNQQGFPGNINVIGGAPTGQPGGLSTQGGAIFANGYAHHLRITNNVVQNNGGAYGSIRIGTPDLPEPNTSSHNEQVTIANNRIIANGGTNLAGGIGLFAGSDGYEVAGNDICGNSSAEYGGGLTVYGYSPGGSINHNRIYLNTSYDEGGGVMIAGQLPANPTELSPGTGPVSIHHNVIQANMANDDGGGIRFLMAGDFPMDVYDNMIVNNISTHEGGGVSLNDTPDVRFYNNTVMKNVTTNTALTATAANPAPAGLSTVQNSAMLQATLPGTAPAFSNPLMFNNIFWDNRAGTRSAGDVVGIGQPGDATPVNYWDIGVADGSGTLELSISVIQQSSGTHAYTDGGSNVTADPGVVDATFEIGLTFNVWRNNPAFVGAIMVVADVPPGQAGDYHLASGSAAINVGATAKGSINAPADDIDGDPRDANVDIGADEYIAGP